MPDAETGLGPGGEAQVYLNPDSLVYHKTPQCAGGGWEPVRVGECLFDPETTACGLCL